MYILGVYISITDLLIVFSGLMVLLLLYLAFEINKLKKLEVKLAIIESRMEREEKQLVRGIKKLRVTKRKTKRKKRRR